VAWLKLHITIAELSELNNVNSQLQVKKAQDFFILCGRTIITSLMFVLGQQNTWFDMAKIN